MTADGSKVLLFLRNYTESTKISPLSFISSSFRQYQIYFLPIKRSRETYKKDISKACDSCMREKRGAPSPGAPELFSLYLRIATNIQ